MLARHFSRLTKPISGVLQHGQGRTLAVLMLLVFAWVLPNAESVPFFLSLRLTQFDTYQRVLPRSREEVPVVIVAVDDASLRTQGQWPWPRTVTADLVRRLNTDGAAVIGLDMVFPERDRFSPDLLAKSFPPRYRELFKSLPEPDEALAAAVAEAPVVLGIAGLPEDGGSRASSVKSANVITRGDGSDADLLHFQSMLTNIDVIAGKAAGQGLLNAEPLRGVVRRVPLLATVGAVKFPALGVEMLRVAGGSGPLVFEPGHRVGTVEVSGLAVRTQTDGQIWLHFGRYDRERVISAADVLAGKVPPDNLKGRIVLVGFTALGLLDVVATPLGERIPGVDVHAQLIESMLSGQTLLRPYWTRWVEVALLLGLGAFLIWAVPTRRARVAVSLATVLAIVLLGVGFAVFRFYGLLLDTASVTFALNAVFVGLLGKRLVAIDDRHKALFEQTQILQVKVPRD